MINAGPTCPVSGGMGGRVDVAVRDGGAQDRFDGLEARSHHRVGEDGTHLGFVQELVDDLQGGKRGLAGQHVAVGDEHRQQVFLLDRPGRGSGTGGSANTKAACTRSHLLAQRRYNAALPVRARAAIPSMVSPPYPTSVSSASVAS